MPRKPSYPYLLAQFYVTEVKKRIWLPSDNAVTMNHAKILLKDYSYEDLLGCLTAIRDCILDVNGEWLNSLAALRHGEPPIIERWFQYKRKAPPIYMTTLYQDWLRRTGADKPEAPKEESCDQYPLPF